ncbi:hypothetical protein CPB85DRAFT_1309560 [Mucidula mucida]|nr:hypothetical protein CPB85DRAFT_1309560 [Mucidula mucida]
MYSNFRTHRIPTFRIQYQHPITREHWQQISEQTKSPQHLDVSTVISSYHSSPKNSLAAGISASIQFSTIGSASSGSFVVSSVTPGRCPSTLFLVGSRPYRVNPSVSVSNMHSHSNLSSVAPPLISHCLTLMSMSLWWRRERSGFLLGDSTTPAV